MVTFLAAAVLVQKYDKDLSVGFVANTYNPAPISLSGKSKFSVQLFNGTGKSIKIPRQTNMWGYGALCFEAKDPAGKSYAITKIQLNWSRNMLLGEYLDSLGSQVRTIDFGDKSWRGLPPGVSGTIDGWKIRAIYEVTPMELVQKEGIWSGKIASKWVDARFN